MLSPRQENELFLVRVLVRAQINEFKFNQLLIKGIVILILVVLFVWFFKKREEKQLKQKRISGTLNRFVMRVGCPFFLSRFLRLNMNTLRKGL